MGDAKKRGPREVRVQQSIERHECERLEAAYRRAQEWANLTPEQRSRRQNARLLMASLPMFYGK